MVMKKKKAIDNLFTRGKSKKSDRCSTSKDMCKGGAIYGLGMVGALVYYISTAPSFWWGVWGVFKAIVWPAFLVYEALKFLGV